MLSIRATRRASKPFTPAQHPFFYQEVLALVRAHSGSVCGVRTNECWQRLNGADMGFAGVEG